MCRSGLHRSRKAALAAQAEEAASAAREYSAALKDELEKLKASTSESTETWALERDALIAKHETKVLAVDAHHEKRVEALKEEHARSGSPLAGRLDVTRFAVAGWSMGGGGCLLAALADPSLKSVLAFAPQ